MDRIGLGGLVTLAIVAPLLVVAPRTAATSAEPQAPGEGAVCPVCGMPVAPYREWLAQIIFENGSVEFFDGAKDLFRYLLARDDHGGERQGPKIVATFVTSYYETRPIPAEDAWYVLGSDVRGPMGAELIALVTREQAEEFKRDHRGQRIVGFAAVTAELLRGLR